MLKVPIYTIEGSKKGNITLPNIFDTPYRPDVIHRACIAIQSHSFQIQGRDLMAGKKTSASTYNPPTGRGISRVPRVKGERYSRSGQAAGIASVVKGRQAHPPKSVKKIIKKINKKEKRFALQSCIAASGNKELVKLRGHKIDEVPSIPLIITNDIQNINKSKDLKIIFQKLGLIDDILRVNRRGRGKGPLLIVGEDKGICKASHNFVGVECIQVKDVSPVHLAPGCRAGRLVVYTESSLDQINKK